MNKIQLPKTYRYSFFSIVGIFLVFIPLLIFIAIWKSGFENSDLSQFPSFVYNQMINVDDNWVGFVLLLLVFIALIAAYINRWLAFLFTELTITEKEIGFKNLFKQTTITNEDIFGFEYYGKGYYIMSKSNPKKKIYIDITLKGINEIKNYLEGNFNKL